MVYFRWSHNRIGDISTIGKSLSNWVATSANELVKVNREGSRFRVLMAAQLNAAAGESPITVPRPLQLSEDPSEDSEEATPSR